MVPSFSGGRGWLRAKLLRAGCTAGKVIAGQTARQDAANCAVPAGCRPSYCGAGWAAGHALAQYAMRGVWRGEL